MGLTAFKRAALLILGLAGAAGAATGDPVFGLWLSDKGNAIVELRPCGDEACGRIVWLEKPRDVDGDLRRDIRNQREALQSRLICGLTMVVGFERAKPGVWEDGYIYNPEDGRTYTARMEMRDDGRLEVRGFVGLPILGKTRIWTRAEGNRGGC